MTPKEFVERFKEHALVTEAKTGVSAKVILAQAAQLQTETECLSLSMGQ